MEVMRRFSHSFGPLLGTNIFASFFLFPSSLELPRTVVVVHAVTRVRPVPFISAMCRCRDREPTAANSSCSKAVHSVERSRGRTAGVVPRSAVAVPGAVTRRRVATALLGPAGGAAGLGGGQPLDDSVAGKHATVDGEVATHHEGTHGRVFLRQRIRFVGEVRLVLTAVDKNEARVATVITVALVRRIPPSSAAAKT